MALPKFALDATRWWHPRAGLPDFTCAAKGRCKAHLLAPLIEATGQDFAELESDTDVFADAKVTEAM